MKVIILDDSFTVRIIIESFLEDLNIDEDEIYSFDNGFDALEFIEKNGADIIFSDIHMPKMNGCEFAFKLFENHSYLKKSFFAISGDESYKSYKKMKENGVHRFLKKPINGKYFNHFLIPEINKIRLQENC